MKFQFKKDADYLRQLSDYELLKINDSTWRLGIRSSSLYVEVTASNFTHLAFQFPFSFLHLVQLELVVKPRSDLYSTPHRSANRN
jgi:hypothetical protein